MRLDYEILLKSPLPQTLLDGPAPVCMYKMIAFSTTSKHIAEISIDHNMRNAKKSEVVKVYLKIFLTVKNEKKY